MSDQVTATSGTNALNSFSFGSLMGDLWDTATNTFKATVSSVESSIVAAVTGAKVAAQNQAQTQQAQAYNLPTVPVRASIDTNTMLFLGAVVVVGLFAFKRK